MLCLRGFLLIVFAAGLVGCDNIQLDPDSVGEVVQPKFELSLSVNYDQAGESNVEYETTTDQPMTALYLLLAAARTRDFKVDYRGTGETAFVEAIGGVSGGENGNDWWIFYVNNELAHQGAGIYQLKSGDQVEWRLGKYDPNAEPNPSDNSP